MCYYVAVEVSRQAAGRLTKEGMAMTKEIGLLREKMKEEGIGTVVLFTGDPHDSEYLCAHYETVAYFTRFTGENARVTVREGEVRLWTDGRFFIQAGNELAGTDIILMRSGEKGVEGFEDYLERILTKGEKLGIEIKAAPDALKEKLERLCKKTGAYMRDAGGAINESWPDRPAVAGNPVRVLDDIPAGGSVTEKLSALRVKTEGKGIYLKALDNVMYLFNLRGSDIPFNPLAYSFAIVDEKEARLYLYPEGVTEELRSRMDAAGVRICGYDEFDQGGLSEGDTIVSEMKAVKTPEQINNIRKYFELDSKAVTEFLYLMDTGRDEMTEMQASGLLSQIRSRIPGFMGESFPTISAYGANAAMAHYEPGDEHPVMIERKGLYLCDSGGFYPGVTTDVTRTVAMGKVGQEEKKAFTLVAAGWAQLMYAVFKEGCTGRNLDILARQELWREGLDYNHGTGHGVGAGLCVHEGPQAIRWKSYGEHFEAPLKEGMLVTDEPGYYKEGAFGIRTENTLLVVKSDHPGFLGFEPLTLVPVDRKCLDLSLLDERSRQYIDDYHALVFERMKGYFDGELLSWLKKQCAAL